ncbi:MAG TPA: TonB-dependent receptor [Pseudomonadales bacterium]|nr:TonB-dependent receptor [Pseudomonadales bacterium]
MFEAASADRSASCAPSSRLSLPIGLCLALAALTGTAAPQDARIEENLVEDTLVEDTLVEETLVVLGSRMPVAPADLAGSVTRLDGAALREARMPFAADLLRTVPTTALARTGAIGGLTQVRMRGSEANHTLVLVDGFEGNDPATGSEFDFAHLRSTTIERIEVLPGPTGALWGSDAIGGAIHLRTPRARDGLDWGLGGARGSRDTSEGTARLGYGGERGSINAVLDHYDTEGSNIARQGDERDGYRSTTLALHGARDLTPTVRVEAIMRTLRADVEFDPTPFPTFLPADGDRESRVARTLTGVHLVHDPDAGAFGDWSNRLTLESLNSDYEDRDTGVLTDERRGQRRRLGLQSAVDYDAGLPGDQRLTLAAEIEQETFAQRGTASAFGDPNQNQTLTHRSLLAEWRWRAPADLRLSAVVRRDFNESFDDATHWRLGARTALPALLQIEPGDVWVSLSAATKNPTFTERFGFTPDSFLGNPELMPERARGIELGWTRAFADERLRAEVLWYRTRLEDEIDGFVFDPATFAFTARNRATDSRREGVEASLELRPGEGTSAILRYAFVDASEADGQGGQVREIRRPRHSGAVSLVHAFAAAPVTARLDTVYNGERDDRDFATFPATDVTLDAYVLMGLAVNWALPGGITVFARADNLLDEDYEDVFGYRAPGRALNIGFEFRRP